MHLQCQANVDDIKVQTKAKPMGDDMPVQIVTLITLEVPASSELSAKLTALQQLCATEKPISMQLGCDQAMFDVLVSKVEDKTKK